MVAPIFDKIFLIATTLVAVVLSLLSMGTFLAFSLNIQIYFDVQLDPKTPNTSPLTSEQLFWNFAGIGSFYILHSVFARKTFKDDVPPQYHKQVYAIISSFFMLFSVLTWTPFPVPAETLNKPISNVELAVGVAVLAAGFIFLNIASMAFK